MKPNEFVSDKVIAAAKKNLEASARLGTDFVPVCISDRGDIFMMNGFDDKMKAFRMMGMVAFMQKFQHVVYVFDAKMRAATAEEAARMTAGEEVRVAPMGQEAQEALAFLVMPLNSDIQGATGKWEYIRACGAVVFYKDHPDFVTQIWKDGGFYKWTLEGYKMAEKLGLRPANGKAPPWPL